MPLLNTMVLMDMIKEFRLVYIFGRPGAYKTALAVRLAHDLLASGFSRYCFTNIDCIFRDEFSNVLLRDSGTGSGHKYLDAVVILDEGGVFLSKHDADELRAFMRKFNIVFIVPSYLEPPRSMRGLTIQRTLDFQKFGLPLLSYSVDLNQRRVKEYFNFYWLNPGEIYGTYSTENAPVTDDGIISSIYELVGDSIKKSTHKKAKQSSLNVSPIELEELEEDLKDE